MISSGLAIRFVIFGVSFLLALSGFLIAILKGERDIGFQIFMSGFLIYTLYSVVSILMVDPDGHENPVRKNGVKLSVLGFGLIALGLSWALFFDININVLVLLLLAASVSMVVGLVMIILDQE